MCKCGKSGSITHKSLRNKITNFCRGKCIYYDKYNPVRYIDKSKNIPKVVAI